MQELFDAVDAALDFAKGPVTVLKTYEFARYGNRDLRYTGFRYTVAVYERACWFGTKTVYPLDADDGLVMDMLQRRYETTGTEWLTGICVQKKR